MSDLDLEDLGLRLELAITRAVQPDASGPGMHRDDLAAAAGHGAVSAEPAWSSGNLAHDPDALVRP